jgi:hypothetical protein
MCWNCGLIVELAADGSRRYVRHALRQPTTGILDDVTVAMLRNHRACGARVHDDRWITAAAAWLTDQWDSDSWKAYRELGLSREDRRIMREVVLDLDLPRILALPTEECEQLIESELDRMAAAHAAV